METLITQSLKNSELYYRRLFEAAQDGILILDARTGRIEDANPSLSKMLGYSHEEFVEKKLWEVGAFRDIEASRYNFEALHENESIHDEDLSLRAKDGRLIQVEFDCTSYLVGNEKLVQCNIRDITERKRAEQETASLAKFPSEDPNPMLRLDPDGSILYANPASHALLSAWKRALGDSAPDPWGDLAAQALTSRKNKTIEIECNGKVYAMLVTPVAGMGYVNICGRDITDEKRAEEALRKSEERFRQLVNNSPDIVYVLDLVERRPIFFNRQGFCGYSRQELQVPDSILMTVHPDDKNEFSIHWQMLLRDDPIEARQPIEYRLKRKDDTWEWVQSRETILARDKHNQPTQVLVTLTPISAQRRAKEKTHLRLSELEVLYESSMAFSQLRSLKAIAQKMLDLLHQKKDWHHTVIRMYHPENETLEVLAFNLPQFNSQEERSAAEERFKAIQHPSQGLSGWVIQHGQALRSNDLKKDPRYFETFPGLCSGLYVPIKIAERVIGVISIESDRPKAFSLLDERLVITLARQAAIAMDDAQVLKNLKRSNMELTSAYDTAIEGWSRALDLRNKEAEGHSQRVTDITLHLAQHIMGVGEEELAHIRRGALLHDIGKLSIPDEILFKPGPLTNEEWVVMRKHPIFAYEVLAPIRYLRAALDIPYCHHEKWDGSGYPRGLKGEQIPLVARIFAVVDVWDALRSDRPYRAAWTKEKARDHICALSGTHFDPQVVETFIQMPY
jgi:PAS domain S-box-containing protein